MKNSVQTFSSPCSSGSEDPNHLKSNQACDDYGGRVRFCGGQRRVCTSGWHLCAYAACHMASVVSNFKCAVVISSPVGCAVAV